MLNDVLKLEEDIKNLYLRLIMLELSELKDSEQYRTIMIEINELTKIEELLLIDIQPFYQAIKKEINKFEVKVMPINLGFNKYAHLIRLNYLLDSIRGDSGVEYAVALYYDINKIILKILDSLINNPYYEELRQDLIYFKYDILYLDYNVENDFLLEIDDTKIALNSSDIRRDTVCANYIDKAVLISDILEYLKQIELLANMDNNKFTLIVVRFVQIVGRVALCNEDLLPMVIDDINDLLENEEIDGNIKEVMYHIIEIFKQIKNSFYFTR